MGALTSDPALFFYAFGAIIVLLFIWVVRLEIKMHRFLQGKDGKTLEDALLSIKKNTDRQIEINKEIAREIDKLDARIQTSLRGFETVRFNAFKGTGSGGNQSFAVALLNEDGDGLILSSLYGRDRFSAFAKPIKGGSSSFELSDEEREALQKARTNISRS